MEFGDSTFFLRLARLQAVETFHLNHFKLDRQAKSAGTAVALEIGVALFLFRLPDLRLPLVGRKRNELVENGADLRALPEPLRERREFPLQRLVAGKISRFVRRRRIAWLYAGIVLIGVVMVEILEFRVFH